MPGTETTAMNGRSCPACGKTLPGKKKSGPCPSCGTAARSKSLLASAPKPQAQPAAAPAPWGKLEWLALALLVVLPFLALNPTLGADFINFDDPQYVSENPHVLRGLSWDGLRWAWTTTHAINWHPLTWLSLMLDTQLFGTHAWGYHLTNLLLHLGNTVVLFLLLRRMTGAVGPGAMVAALFAVHPLHVESVAWVSERKDVFSTFFGLLALLAYAHYAQERRWLRYLAVVGWLALSLLAKPMLVTLPFVMLLLDYWPLKRWPTVGAKDAAPVSLRWLVAEKVPLLLLVIPSCLMTLKAQQEGQAVSSMKLTPLAERLANSAMAYVQYLGQTLVPLDLAAYYPHPHARGLTAAPILAALFLAGITFLFWRARQQRPYLLVGWLWYLGTLVPVIGIVQVGGQGHADRYTYFPLIGIFLLAVWGLTDLVRVWQRERIVAWLVGAVLVCLMALSWLQASLWRDSETLWRHAVEVTDNNWMACELLCACPDENGRRSRTESFLRELAQRRPEDASIQQALGSIEMRRGQMDAASVHFQEALRLDPDQSLAHFQLGQVLLRQQRLAEAAGHFRRFLELDPESSQGNNLLGLALLEMGHPEEARAHFEKALELAPRSAPITGSAMPDSSPVIYNLGSTWQAQQQWHQAAACYAECVALQPRNSKFHRALAFALHHEGQARRAQEEYQESLRLDPSWPRLFAARAWRLATDPDARRRNGRRALEYAEQAYQAVGARDPQVADALAAAQAEAGQFEQAARTAEEAAAEAEKLGQQPLAGQLRERAALYARKEPYRARP